MQRNKSILSFLFPEDNIEEYKINEIQGIVKNIKIEDIQNESDNEDSDEESFEENESNPDEETKSQSETELSNEEPLFPEKHYEKEAKSKYGDDADSALVEQMEKDEDFKNAMKRTEKIEGGYNNDPTDPGKETKYGISKKWYPDENIKDLTRERADYILYRDYYKSTNIDKLPDGIRNQAFDNSVIQGQGNTIKHIQNAVGSKPDGILGSKTLDAVNNSNIDTTLKSFINNVKGRYKEIESENPKAHEKYKRGWGNRVNTY